MRCFSNEVEQRLIYSSNYEGFLLSEIASIKFTGTDTLPLTCVLFGGQIFWNNSKRIT